MTNFVFKATQRTDLGKGASRRLRRENKYIPAIVYGGDKDAQSISLEQNEFYRQMQLDDTLYTSILKLDIDGKKEQVIIKDMQRHLYKEAIVMHVDFQRVDSKTKVNMSIPFEFINEEECKGVRLDGGMLMRLMNDVEISALPQDLPDSIQVDVANLEVGDSIMLSEIKLPEGVEIPALALDQDNAVVNVQAARTEEEDLDAPVEAPETEAEEGEGDAEEE